MKFTDIPTPLTNHYMHKPSGTVIKGRTLFEHAQHLERQLTREHEFGEDMAKQVIAVEDALGFKSDDIPESDKHRLVMERIRDLIAAEGELGDLRAAAHTLIGRFDSYWWGDEEPDPAIADAITLFKESLTPTTP